MGMMAPPYQRPLPAQQGYPARGTRAAAPPPVETNSADAGLRAVSSESEPAGENVTERISGMRFEPASITVESGTTVTWVHGSSMPHTVTGNTDRLHSSTLYKRPAVQPYV
jgi:plastocyanin